MSKVFKSISEKYDSMSKTQKKIADVILKDAEGVSFCTVGELSKKAESSEASITRFATFLGYTGYPEMQRELREQMKQKLSMKERLASSYKEYDGKDAGVTKIFNEEVDRINHTLENLNLSTFFDVVNEIVKAKRIYIVCSRSSMSLGIFFKYYLSMIFNEVFITDNEELLNNVNSEDVVISIIFSRYTKRTIKLTEYAHKKGAKTIGITDNLSSPIIKYVSLYLLAETKASTYLDSFVGPFSIINALLTQIGVIKNKELEEKFSELEEMWQEFDIFENYKY